MALPKHHQLFFQSLISQGALPAEQAANLFNNCEERVSQHCGSTVSNSISADELGTISTTINPKLAALHLELKTIKSPYEKEPFWGIVNTASDAAARLSTGLTPVEVSFFFAMVEELLDSGGSMRLVDMQNAGREHRLGVLGTGKLIALLSRRQWLWVQKRPGGGCAKVVFGVRSMLELPNVRAFVLASAKSLNAGEGDDEGTSGSDRRGRGRGKPRGTSSGDGDDAGEEDEEEDDDLDEEETPPVRKRRRGSKGAIRKDDDDYDSSD